MLVENSRSWQHQELIPCPTQEMEWIDHRIPYEGYDGSDVEEDDIQADSNVQSSIDSLFGSEDNDN